MRSSVTVFARPPCPGRVKTRLSPALPPDLAARLYRAMLDDAVAAVAATPASARRLAWSEPPAEAGGFEAPAGFEVTLQSAGDLGSRLARHVEECLAGHEAALVIGADAPELDATMLGAALEALATHDLVLGPTPDGGYHLIGLRSPAATLFDGIDWSTERVMSQTLDRAACVGLRVAVTAPCADIDTPADLVELLRRVLAGKPCGAATLVALRDIGLLPA